jgi:hypothetical protein
MFICYSYILHVWLISRFIQHPLVCHCTACWAMVHGPNCSIDTFVKKLLEETPSGGRCTHARKSISRSLHAHTQDLFVEPLPRNRCCHVAPFSLRFFASNSYYKISPNVEVWRWNTMLFTLSNMNQGAFWLGKTRKQIMLQSCNTNLVSDTNLWYIFKSKI